MIRSENATVTSKGQVTIPKAIRDELGIDEGTEVEFVLDEDGDLIVRPKKPAMERLRAVRAKLSNTMSTSTQCAGSRRPPGAVTTSVTPGDFSGFVGVAGVLVRR